MKKLIIVRGAGDLATGTIYELHKAGFPVLALECEKPAAIRREVCFSEAVYQEKKEVEGVTAVRIDSIAEMDQVHDKHQIPILVDESGRSIEELKPYVVVDLILAKKNLGTYKEMAPLVIGAGPGFVAGQDVHVVIETMRGYQPGKAIYEGSALPNTGIPGMVGGYAKERVIHSPAKGKIHNVSKIGDIVKKGQKIAEVSGVDVLATIDGILRGLIREGYEVGQGMKIADIDPRLGERENCYRRSDKSIAIGKGILEVIRLRMRMQMLLEMDSRKHKAIAFVGAGGKTSCMYDLAKELSRCGKQVIVTTSTHIMRPTQKLDGVRVIGCPCEETGKLQGLSNEEYALLKDQCDILLVEADGAKRKSIKAPDVHEPVIPHDIDLVVGIAGARAVGKKIGECAHRVDRVCHILNKSPEDVIILQDLLVLLDSEQGQKKKVNCDYRKVISQGEYLTEQERSWLQSQKEIAIYSKNKL